MKPNTLHKAEFYFMLETIIVQKIHTSLIIIYKKIQYKILKD